MPLFLPVHCLEFAFNSLSCKQVTVPANTHERGLEQNTVCQEMENHQVPSQGLLATSVILQHFLSLIFPGLNPFEKFSSVAQWGLAFCEPMDCSTPGLPVHHQLPEFIQTHVH